MSVRFFNTYTREIEEFVPMAPPLVRMYTCGPTVYNFAHIGNFRAYIFEDLLQRHLEVRGYTVRRVMNLTDVDDKTIRNSRAAGEPLEQFTRRFKEAFFEDLKTLRIEPAAEYPAATEPRFIAKMIEMIAQLESDGVAYQADDRSVYFRLSKFPEYGRLAHLNLEELRPTGRISNDEYEKESIGDFALWKAWDEADGDVGWEGPWGRGRPGWHIECSAMSWRYLGETFDIHGIHANAGRHGMCSANGTSCRFRYVRSRRPSAPKNSKTLYSRSPATSYVPTTSSARTRRASSENRSRSAGTVMRSCAKQPRFLTSFTRRSSYSQTTPARWSAWRTSATCDRPSRETSALRGERGKGFGSLFRGLRALLY